MADLPDRDSRYGKRNGNFIYKIFEEQVYLQIEGPPFLKGWTCVVGFGVMKSKIMESKTSWLLISSFASPSFTEGAEGRYLTRYAHPGTQLLLTFVS